MTTVRDMIQIFENPPSAWCKGGVRKALVKLRKYDPGTELDTLIKDGVIVPEWACFWAKDIGDRDKMKQIILEAKDPKWALWWAEGIGDREEMKQIILEANDPGWAFRWAIVIGDRGEMKQIVLKSKAPAWIDVWLSNIEDCDEMKQLLARIRKHWEAAYAL